MWIVTDAIAAQPGVLAKEGVIRSFYDGLIGIRPAVKKNARYYQFKDQYLQSNHSHTAEDLLSYSLMVYDAIGLVETALKDITKTPLQDISCASTEGWREGEEVLAALLNTNYSGVTGNTNFTLSGESRWVVSKFIVCLNLAPSQSYCHTFCIFMFLAQESGVRYHEL